MTKRIILQLWKTTKLNNSSKYALKGYFAQLQFFPSLHIDSFNHHNYCIKQLPFGLHQREKKTGMEGKCVNPLKNPLLRIRPKQSICHFLPPQNTLPSSPFSHFLLMSEKVIYLFFIYSFLFTGTMNPFPLYLLKTPTALNSLSLLVMQVSCICRFSFLPIQKRRGV